MADEHISTVLEQLRRIMADERFRNSEFQINLLRGITVHALDQVLYNIEDVINDVLHLGVSTELAAAGLEKFASTQSKAASAETATLYILRKRLEELEEVLIGIVATALKPSLLLAWKERGKHILRRLINLRYLSLAGSKVLKILPETLCDLHNLQSLDLTGCSSLRKLPDGMGKLMNLRADHNDAKEFTLGDFEKLNNLCGHVRVKLVGNAMDADEAIRANLWNKKDLDRIRINLDGDIGKESQDVIKKALNPPSDLNIEFVGWWF
ncbi:hypothetical protein GOBAR_DD23658 [Gossypium barbadense]|nr:hypothetical protein GOBAR_DD23658 [Gossypium barbadense]